MTLKDKFKITNVMHSQANLDIESFTLDNHSVCLTKIEEKPS